MLDPFSIEQLVNYVRMVEDVPPHIAAICDELERSFSQEGTLSPPKEKKKYNISPERREKMRQHMLSIRQDRVGKLTQGDENAIIPDNVTHTQDTQDAAGAAD